MILFILSVLSLISMLTACTQTGITEVTGYAVGGMGCRVNAELYIPEDGVCQTGNMITIAAKNSANIDFVNLHVIVKGSSGLQEGETTKTVYRKNTVVDAVSYQGRADEIRITPGIMQDGSLLYCYENQVVLDNIPKC